MQQHYGMRHGGCDFFEYLQPFSANFSFEIAEPGDVAARMCQIVDEAAADRIGNLREHGRDGAVDLLERGNAGIAVHKYHVGRECYQVRRCRTHVLDVATDDISEVDL